MHGLPIHEKKTLNAHVVDPLDNQTNKNIWGLLSSSAIIEIGFRTLPSIFSNDQGTVRRYPVSN